MTNELEKTFFDTFEVETKYKCTKDGNCYFQECSKCDWYTRTYPQITDSILLELICIHNQYLHPFSIYSEKKEFLKNDILECMINILNYFYEHEMGEYSKLKRQVRKLFEEG